MRNCPGKKPSFNWYPKDWLSDLNLMATAHSTQGIWIKLLCYMWINDLAHEIILTRDEFRRLGATDDEIDQFVKDAIDHKFCDLKIRDSAGRFLKFGEKSHPALAECQKFHILSRRFQRDNEQRRKWRESKQKSRLPSSAAEDKKGTVRGNSNKIQPLYPSPSPSPTSKKKKSGLPAAPTTPEQIGQSLQDLLDEKTNRHFEHHVGDFFKSIKSKCDQITAKNNHDFNPFQWVQVKINKKCHPAAIDYTLEGLLNYWGTTENPWGYAEKIYKSARQNFSEQDAIIIHKEIKRQEALIANIMGLNFFEAIK